jgi:uncharacterized DUF497 family protein
MEHRFEWNDEKARVNLKKHDVDFQEASTVFDDPVFITFLDEEHSADEERYITIGLSGKQRLLMVAHTERGNKIRIISARKVTKNEENFYVEAR